MRVATSGIWMKFVISIAGKKHYLWRAVAQDGFVLDVLGEHAEVWGAQAAFTVTGPRPNTRVTSRQMTSITAWRGTFDISPVGSGL